MFATLFNIDMRVTKNIQEELICRVEKDNIYKKEKSPYLRGFFRSVTKNFLDTKQSIPTFI